tara:strand:+ start:25587 stop:25937 length:351 start_codon:yes stop_codon:yes gene_type:complete
MRAILIDPTNQTITEVEYDGNYKSIYGIIGNGCHTFSVFNYKNGDGFYHDDEGLFNENIGGIIYKDWNSPVVGKVLVLGCDDEGDSIAPISYIEELKEGLKFLRPQQLEEYFEQFN